MSARSTGIACPFMPSAAQSSCRLIVSRFGTLSTRPLRGLSNWAQCRVVDFAVTMHFAYTPRKSSNPPPFRPSTSRLAQLRRTSPRAVISIFIIFVLASYFLLTKSHRDAYYEQEPSGIPYVVIVTVTDSATFDDGHVKLIQENRQQYAAIHGQYTDHGLKASADMFRVRDLRCTDDRLSYRQCSHILGQADGHATRPDEVP